MDNNKARTRLEEERERLERLISQEDEGTARDQPQNATEELSTYDQHPADQGTETFEQEKALSILEQHQTDLAEVERAFKRFDEGTYGKCEACGKDIPEERLEARPATRFCLDDQKQVEQGLHPQSGPSH
ncbi:MAG: TraR/DksA C4-type zinc finger protein [Actinomycetota bacterium]|nr:TraR/DksA C4-type zinc finger protein [Actinomycetota bacterium]